MDNIIKQGYYYLDIVTGFIYVLNNYDTNENQKLRLIEIINKTKIIVSTGLRSKLQLSAMICRLIEEVNKKD